MHINMKYYVVSIGAIFISLGIGVLVGFNISDNQLLYNQQSEMITDLEVQFDKFQNINRDLEDELKLTGENYNKSLEFIKVNFDKIVADRLIEKNIGIISTNENNKYTQNLSSLISNSGGTVNFDIVINDIILQNDKIQEINDKFSLEFKESSEVIDFIVEELSNSGDSSRLRELENMNLITINYLESTYNEYNEVVIAGGSDGKQGTKGLDEIDLNLIKSLKEQEKNIVGIQESKSKINYSDLYFEQKISTVDNIEDDLGRLSLVLLLQNANVLGQFGVLENAESIIPYDSVSKEN